MEPIKRDVKLSGVTYSITTIKGDKDIKRMAFNFPGLLEFINKAKTKHNINQSNQPQRPDHYTNKDAF
jgi:hypothetical protein